MNQNLKLFIQENALKWCLQNSNHLFGVQFVKYGRGNWLRSNNVNVFHIASEAQGWMVHWPWFVVAKISTIHLSALKSTIHYSDVIMCATVSQITSLTIAYSTVYSGADQRKHQTSASLAFVWGIHRWPVNSPHKWPVTRKMFPFDDVIMNVSF